MKLLTGYELLNISIPIYIFIFKKEQIYNKYKI